MSGIVKPLAWETDHVGGGLKAGEYRVRAGVWTHGYYWTKGDNEARTGFEDEEAAQSAATADFEQYVLSCLDPSYASSQAEIERLRTTLEWVRKNYASGNTTEINTRIEAVLAPVTP